MADQKLTDLPEGSPEGNDWLYLVDESDTTDNAAGSSKKIRVNSLPSSGGVWGSITGTLSSQSDLQTALDNKADSSHTHSASDVTSGTFADSRISETSVTQHAGALSVTESQISDLEDYQPLDPVLTATTASFTTADQAKLGGIEAAATADQTGAEIKVAYEAEANTNAFTDVEQSKLAGIETNATTDQTDLEIEAAYNNQVPEVSQFEAEAGTLTDVRRWTPQRVSQAISALGGSGGTDVATVQAIAAGSTLGLQQGLLAEAGQPGLTVLAVGYTTSGKVQGVSLGSGNVVEVYASGADFNSGAVLYREFMSLGEPIAFTGLSNGAIITSTSGFYGVSEQVDGGDESPMPLLSYGLSFDFTFFFGFRNCNSYNPGGTGANQGWVHVVNGPLDNTIRIAFGSGVTVQGQENIQLSPWEYRRLYTDGNTEYILEGTSPMMACHNANMDLQPEGRFYDSRLIMPLTNDGITWPRSGFISAPFNNTQVDFYVRDGAEGRINSTLGTGVSPGSPVDFDAGIGVGTGASDQDYEPNGATRVQAIGLVSAYSGADSAGLEASPLMPTSAMSQIVAQPFFVRDTGDGGNSGVAIASPFVGTAEIYSWNDSTNQLDLAYTVPLNRSGVTVASETDQRHPSAGMVANETVGGAVSLVGTLNPGVVIADVPITVVSQSGNGPITNQTLRSQNGTTTSNIGHDDDETLMLGVTPPERAVEIRLGTDGILYKRVVGSGGTETWAVA
ncbi:MAG: hypothetical protein AAF578_00350 [Pseudomonadota bacterium]